MNRIALLALAVLGWPALAQAEALVVSLSSNHVQITPTYTGAELVLFGVVETDRASVSRPEPYDVVVSALGPRGPVVVREKRQLGPIWVNRAQRRFSNIPAALLILANRPIADMTTPLLRQRFRLGIEPIVADPFAQLDDQRAPFRASLIRLKTKAGLFLENDKGVSFLTPIIFRAPIPVPATAPLGIYEVEVALLAGGVELARTKTSFAVTKTGFEQAITQAAHTHPLFYGFATAGMALAFGWFASVIFRRD